MTARPPITDKVTGLRQRQLADGRWRVWWEPNATARAQGFKDAVELSEAKPTWSVREAKKLNVEVARRRRGEAPRRARSGGRTINALIHEYRGSRKFKSKEPATKRGYEISFRTIATKWGSNHVQEFSKPVLHAWYETLYDNSGPAQAMALVRAISILFSYAEILGWRPENSNPCFRLGMETVRRRKRSATWVEFDALLNAAERLGWHAAACGIALATLQAQRQTDVISARLSEFRQVTANQADNEHQIWIWELIRSKKDNYGVMPLHDEVIGRVLSQVLRIRPTQIDRLLIDEATGAPYSGDLFRKRWAAIRSEAAKFAPSLITNPLQFRDLRRTFGVWARAGGGLKEDVGDVLGNSAALDPQLGETYMPPSFYTAQRAVQAVQRPPTPKERKKA